MQKASRLGQRDTTHKRDNAEGKRQTERVGNALAETEGNTKHQRKQL